MIEPLQAAGSPTTNLMVETATSFMSGKDA